MLNEKDSYSKQELPRKNLAHGKKIESVLSACKKFDLNDRVCFAENLGRIIENLITKNQSVTLRKIFIEAFDNSAESLYKKRKSLVTWPNEESIAENLRSKARDYLSLINAVAKFESKYTTEDVEKIKKRLILVLISGSSFDDNRNTRDRLYEESRSHYKKQINRLVNKVLESSDLDYQFHFAEKHIPWDSINLNRLGLNSKAPHVKIADIYMSQEIEKYTLLDVEKGGDDDEIRTKLVKEIVEKGLKIPFHEKYADEFEPHDDLCEISKKISGEFWHLKTLKEFGFEYYIKSEANFEIRYDPLNYNWCGVIYWECGNRVENFSDFDTYDFRNGLLTKDYEIFDWFDQSLKASLYKRNKETDTYMLFWDDQFTHDEKFERSSGFRGQINYSTDHLLELIEHLSYGFINELDEFALSDEEDISFKVIPNEKLRDEEKSYISFGKYTPAPRNSLAHIVLHNLAYAPIERRIDTLLIKDAIRQYRDFEVTENEIKDAYINAIQKKQ